MVEYFNLNPPPKDAPLLITGASGFVGRNLAARLKALGHTDLMLYDIDTPAEKLEEYTGRAAFVFHLAGVNRPKDTAEFYTGNADLTKRLLERLQAAGNKAPVLLSSSAQAGNGSDYARSKEEAETAVFAHGYDWGAPVFIFRLPGVFGKWARPDYNSVVATFCHNIARGLPIEIHDAEYILPVCYIDDVVNSFLGVLDGRVQPPPRGLFLGITPLYKVKLGKLAQYLYGFKESRETLAVPHLDDPFQRKLYATWLSYLPADEFSYPLQMHTDERGSFTEFLRTPERGQVSVNVAKPGVTKGNHWHDTKNEKFLVVSGEGVVRFRRLGEGEVIEYPVSGERLEVVDIPTGYTHNIENTGSTDLVTIMWASEAYDEKKPDTWSEEV